MEKELLLLFKAIEIKNKEKYSPIKSIFQKTIKNGYIFSDEIYGNYSELELNRLVTIIEKELILTSKQYNQSFHKSWQKIKESSIEQLMIEQIFHYITTYGYESLGIYDSNNVYIPIEKLNLPKTNVDKINLIIIKGYTHDEIKIKVMELLKSGIALKKETIDNIVEILRTIGIDEPKISDIKNKEIKAILYDQFNIIPKNEIEFLRYLIYKTTGKTLLIKDTETIKAIKESKIDFYVYFNNYRNQYGLENLAKIFYRFKPLFLAFKNKSSVNKIINKIRKLAIKNHKPMQADYLNNITSGINDIDETKIRNELEKVNPFRKIRLAYALKYRTIDNIDSILYRIRNGKSWATNFEYTNQEKTQSILDIVCKTIFGNGLKNKKIYLPGNINYALPYTEKQFIGNIPSGTCISVEKNMLIGIHWNNIKKNRIDLDLSMLSMSGKYGWDGRYRNDGRSILFSGDMTDATRGATEVFYIGKQNPGNYLICVNYFNYSDEIEVPFTIFVASEKVTNLTNDYMVNQNNIVCNVKSQIDKRQQIIGLLNICPDKTNFYLTNANIGKSITAGNKAYIEQSRKYYLNFYKNIISLKDLFEYNGIEITNDKKNCDIDLSHEKLEKDTIIKLFY